MDMALFLPFALMLITKYPINNIRQLIFLIIKRGEVMRIDAYNKISQVYNANKSSSQPKAKGSSFSDKLEISETGHAIQVAKKAIKNEPDIRQAKVDDIKNRIETGTYNVTMQEVADKLLDSYFDTKI